MKKRITALAMALSLVGALAACSTDDNPNGTNSGTSAGQVARRYSGQTIYNGRSYYDDGQVYGGDRNTVSRDLTNGARDIVRGAGDAIEDVGRGIGDVARDVTGTRGYSGTPSWEPDSSARY